MDNQTAQILVQITAQLGVSLVFVWAWQNERAERRHAEERAWALVLRIIDTSQKISPESTTKLDEPKR